MIPLIILFITVLPVAVYCHVDDVFYIETTTTTSVIVGWYGESDADQKVRDWKIFVNDVKKYYGSGSELKTSSRVTISDSTYQPGHTIKVTVTVYKSDDSTVHPLLNEYVELDPLPAQNISLEQEATSNDLAGSGILSWVTSPSSHQDSYDIRYKGTYNTPSEWSNATNTVARSLPLTGLVPGDLYTFQVTAFSEHAESSPVESQIELYPGHVTDVNIKSLLNGISLKWTLPPGIVHRMEGYVEPLDDSCETGPMSFRDDDEGADIYGLSNACTYVIHICAVTRNGLKGKSVDVAATTMPLINSTIQLSEPPTETSATFIYTETNTKFDHYYIKLRYDGTNFDKAKDDPYRSVTFSRLTPGHHYYLEFYTIVAQRGRAPAVASKAFLFDFRTAPAAESQSSGSTDSDGPSGAVIGISVLVVIFFIIIIVLAVCLLKSRRQKDTTSKSTTINNNLKRVQGSVNAAGPQSTGQTMSYMEITDEVLRNRDWMGYEQPMPHQREEEKTYEIIRNTDKIYDNTAKT